MTQLVDHLEVSPEAIDQRMNDRAIAFFQELLRQALTAMRSSTTMCPDQLFEPFTKVYIADSTSVELPETLKDSFPGPGGSASAAGAKIQFTWDSKSSTFEPCTIPSANSPDNKSIDTVVELAHKGALFLFA